MDGNDITKRPRGGDLEEFPELQRLMMRYLGAYYFVHQHAQFLDGNNLITKIAEAGSKALIEHHVNIGPAHFPGNPKLENHSGHGYFTGREPSRNPIAAVLLHFGVFPLSGKDETIEDLVRAKGLKLDNTVVISVGKPEYTMMFAPKLRTDYDEVVKRNQAEIAAAQKTLDEAITSKDRTAAEVDLMTAHSAARWGLAYTSKKINLYKIIQDALELVVDPENLAQFSFIIPERALEYGHKNIPPHGYAIDLSDPELVRKIQGLTVALEAKGAELLAKAKQKPGPDVKKLSDGKPAEKQTKGPKKT